MQMIEDQPFITDEQLMQAFDVSIQTIRLDRLELRIPELRERIKQMAEQSRDPVKSMPIDEIIGEIIDLQLNKSGISIFEVGEEHVFSRTRIARGHHVFAQANSLAVAVVDDEVVLTASANIRFRRQIMLHEKCVAKAYVRSISKAKKTSHIDVYTYVGDEIVFEGQFLIYRSTDWHIEGGTVRDENSN